MSEIEFTNVDNSENELISTVEKESLDNVPAMKKRSKKAEAKIESIEEAKPEVKPEPVKPEPIKDSAPNTVPVNPRNLATVQPQYSTTPSSSVVGKKRMVRN
jgi:hypothetical protein